MGWWKTKSGLLGDGALDITEEFLSALRDEYVVDHGRKPTIDELMLCLQQSLSRSLEEYVSGADGLDITEIRIRTRSSPTKASIIAGDIFAIPLAAGGFAFGRLTPQWMYAEFFDIRSHRILRISELMRKSVIQVDFLISLDALENRRWKIIGHRDYTAEFEFRKFRIGNQVGCGRQLVKGFVDVSSALRPATEDESALPPMNIAGEKVIEKILLENITTIVE